MIKLNGLKSLLVIAISEEKPKEFKIIAIDIKDEIFYDLDLKEKDFFDRNGKPVWDLFAVTEGVRLAKSNNKYKVMGKAYIKRYYSAGEIKKFFASRRMTLNMFMNKIQSLDEKRDNSPLYGIVKLDSIRLKRPKYEGNRLKQYVIVPNRRIGKGDIELLNKDYKWISYWENISEDLWEAKIKQWEEYLNRKDKEVYAICFSIRFSNGRRRWIGGFHCL